jgi:hypothetical protein
MMAVYIEAVLLPYDPSDTYIINEGPNVEYIPIAVGYFAVAFLGVVATVLLLMDRWLRFGVLASILLFLSPFLNDSAFMHIPVIIGTLGATLGIFLFSFVAMVVLSFVRWERRRIRQAYIAMLVQMRQLYNPHENGYGTTIDQRPMEPRWGTY